MSRGWVILYGVLVGVALVTAIVGGYLRWEPWRDAVTRIVASPCQQDPEGRECARLRKQIVGVEPLSVPCTSLRRIVRDKEILARFTVCLDPRQDLEQPRSTNESRGEPDAETPDQPTSDDGADGAGAAGDGDPGGGGDGGPAVPPTEPDPPATGGGGGSDPDDPGSGGGGGEETPPADTPSTVGGLGVQTPLDPTLCGVGGSLLCP